MSEVIPFPESAPDSYTVRILPEGTGNRDFCTAIIAAPPWEPSGLETIIRGKLRMVTLLVEMFVDRHYPGRPVEVHPECRRRAGA